MAYNNFRAGGGSGGDNQPLKNATAPYNFVAYEPGAALSAFNGGVGHWSGVIKCRLTALTPLMISEVQKKGEKDTPTECEFLKIGGVPVIPGSSIKGMLRALVEILSFSEIGPVSDEPLFYRNVNSPDFARKYDDPRDPSNVLGGYLRQHGADYTLLPVRVQPVPWTKKIEDDYLNDRGDPCLVATGGIITRGKHSAAYKFSRPDPAQKPIAIDRELVHNLERQMTENQKKRWKNGQDGRKNRLASDPGHPVFYRLENDRICELGLCRIFRLGYKYDPASLLNLARETLADDFARNLFGRIGDKARKGKVAIDSAYLHGKEAAPVEVILGAPKPTCLAHYLTQDPSRIKRRQKSKLPENRKDTLADYNNSSARPRGRKLYWHHDLDTRLPEGLKDKKNVQSRLHPMARDSQADIEIHVSRLTDLELGCLMEAIDLPPGCAHRLGMAKSLGFGSVRLELVEVAVEDDRLRYDSLLDRLNGERLPIEPAELEELRAAFRKTVYDLVVKKIPQWGKCGDYSRLPPIKQLYIMLDYKSRPKKEKVANMELGSFKANALLPAPEEIGRPQKP